MSFVVHKFGREWSQRESTYTESSKKGMDDYRGSIIFSRKTLENVTHFSRRRNDDLRRVSGGPVPSFVREEREIGQNNSKRNIIDNEGLGMWDRTR